MYLGKGLWVILGDEMARGVFMCVRGGGRKGGLGLTGGVGWDGRWEMLGNAEREREFVMCYWGF